MALYNLGFALRETGLALERLGVRLSQPLGKELLETYNEANYYLRHRPVQSVGTSAPEVASSAFVAPTAAVVGDVKVGIGASVWYGAVVRGDASPVSIGDNTNVQDGTVISSAPHFLGHAAGTSTTIGSSVTIGHGVHITGATIGDRALIGMNAVLEKGVTVESEAMVAAGAVVASGTTVPTGELWGGAPAKFMRALKPSESDYLQTSADEYASLAQTHVASVDEASP